MQWQPQQPNGDGPAMNKGVSEVGLSDDKSREAYGLLVHTMREGAPMIWPRARTRGW